MGKNNQARRRMKAAARREAAARRGAAAGREARAGHHGGSGHAFTRVERPPDRDLTRDKVAVLVGHALDALDRGHVGPLDDAAASLTRLCAVPEQQRIVVASVESALVDATTAAWERGWQPADVHRLAVRHHGSAEQLLLVDAMRRELDRYAPATIDPRWLAQLHELTGVVEPSRAQPVIQAQRQRGVDWLPLISNALAVLHLLLTLPAIERLSALPGEAVPPAGPPGGSRRAGQRARESAVDARILSRVRALLAKAESTSFEAEAETFTAGAQALMARHSIDAALLAADQDARVGGHAAPQGRRIGIDNPYEAPKAMLLNAVATANRCRMVWSKELGFGTVIGFESDLESVEVLFTSLLVQATRAMTSAGSRTDHYGRSRTRSFRQSFLAAYAGRIGERLSEVTVAEEESAAAASTRSHGRELVPLLSARGEEVDRVVDDWFPGMSTRAVGSGRDAEGWHSGRAAADRAQLGTGSAIEQTG